MADLNNSPGRDGHAIMAGAFIGEFAEDTPWVHLDIAGTADRKAFMLWSNRSNRCDGQIISNICGTI